MKYMFALLFLQDIDWSWIINSFSIFGEDGDVIGYMFCLTLAWLQLLFYGFLIYKLSEKIKHGKVF